MIPTDWLDNMGAPFIKRGAGIAIAGVLGDEAAFRFHGRTFALGPPPTATTLFELGALTQIFTAILLALTVRKHRIALDQPIAEMVPEFRDLPKWITPMRLATHAAGIPRVPPEIARRSLLNTRNPYAQYSTEELIRWGTSFRPRREPAANAFSYSHLGMALLGLVLADVYDAPFETALRREVCKPLGLNDTVFECGEEQSDRFATPHDGKGRPAAPWAFPGLGGAGGLQSTAQDMSLLVKAVLRAKNPDSPLSEAIADTLEIRRRARRPDGEGGGLGWSIVHAGKPPAFIHKLDGRTNGSQAFIAVAPGPGLGAAVLTNNGPKARDAMKPPHKHIIPAFTSAWSRPAVDHKPQSTDD